MRTARLAARTKLTLALAIVLSTAAAKANLLTNGSFESPAIAVGGVVNVNSGSATIPGWTVIGTASQTVAIVSGSYAPAGYSLPAEDGSQWLDLTGSGNQAATRGITQTVSTVQGKTYTLTFWVGNVSGPNIGTTSTAGLKINGVPAGDYPNVTPGTTMNWQQFTYSFIATQSSTTIEFDNLDPAADNSNALDNVDLEEGGSALPLPVNLIVNGDFETPVAGVGKLIDYQSGSTALTGWNVIGTAPDTVDQIDAAFVVGRVFIFPESGSQWLDLTGSNVSTGTRGITQTVPTISGASYILTFWVGNVDDPGGIFGVTSTVGLKINGTSAGSFTSSSTSVIMTWQQFTVTFTATGSSTVIEFDNLDPSTDSSNGLDNVILQQMGGSAPSVSAGGVVSASAFGGFTSVAPGSWIEIYGSNLASDSRTWRHPISTASTLPPRSTEPPSPSAASRRSSTTSAPQVNALVPSNVATGSQQMIVNTPLGPSAAYTIKVNATQPGLLAPPSFIVGGTQYTAALFTDGVTYVLPTGAISGVTSRPANPGDTIVLYGVGFGPVSPAIPAGQLVQESNTLASTFQIFMGGIQATTSYSGLAPDATGLYQFNVVVPNVPAGNAVPLTFTLGGVSGTQTLYLAVGN
jgi:uncharacterized protein (TIGR03437 family)